MLVQMEPPRSMGTLSGLSCSSAVRTLSREVIERLSLDATCGKASHQVFLEYESQYYGEYGGDHCGGGYSHESK